MGYLAITRLRQAYVQGVLILGAFGVVDGTGHTFKQGVWIVRTY